MEKIKKATFFNKVKSKKVNYSNFVESKIDKLPFIKNGQHFWGKLKDGKMSVFIKDDNYFFIAGNWGGSIEPSKFEFIEIIKEPK